jgi:hypothetical protein
VLLTHEQFLAALAALSLEQIRQAGQRYTPGIDPRAPNLRIASLFTAIENVACGADAQARFQAALDSLSEAWDRAKHCSQRRDAIQERLEGARATLGATITRLRERDAEAGAEWVERLTGLETDLLADMAHWRTEVDKLAPLQEEHTHSSARDTAQRNLAAIGRCLAIVGEEKEYTDTATFKVLCDPQLLLKGEWGTGKTHLLCDITQKRIDRGQATLLVLAKNFQGQVVKEICGRIEAGRTTEEIFDQIQEAASRLRERAIIVVDGVNEGRRREWQKTVTALRALIADRPGIGLIITCRTPFESYAIAKHDLQALHQVTHHGFEDQEFDAQAAFFEYYNLPLPEVPLLDREFSRPLTLKLICQSLQNLTDKKMAAGFVGIASGQKGMTYVFETFVNGIGKPIEDAFLLTPKGCWRLLKGNDQIPDQRCSGFAPCMATTLRGYVRPSEADRIVAANYPSFGPAKRRKLVEALRVNGLIEEDAVWYTSRSGVKSRVVLRLPYQRFSDHLIARHLLKVHLDVSSASAIKRSFSPTSPLGLIFRIPKRYQREYAEPGWAQALITEFPERVGSRLPSKQRELFFALPPNAQDFAAYFEPFIDGLFWRNPDSFSEGTRQVINNYLNSGSETWERVVDALAAVSTKPQHPYHSQRLYNFLARYTMADRDLFWSEYLRRRYASPTMHRLFTWASRLNSASMTEGSAKALVVLLSLALTTVVRNDRDLATKALVVIGEKSPEVLFAHCVASLGFNDPYVSERMLAAAYGVTLSLVDSEAAPTFRPLLGALARSLYSKMFGPGARYTTHHALKRDYALGIIEVAQSAGCARLPQTAARYLALPSPRASSTFASDGTPDIEVAEALGNAIQMDFGNYVIGSLVPERRNYDDKNPEYVKVRAQIERRMLDLGYRKERFGTLDGMIGNSSFRDPDEHKVDRYGKKYSWIAFFEMWGERKAKNALPRWRMEQRTPYCDIDPSFPKRPPDWSPPIPDLFGDLSIDTESWVEGGYKPAWNPLLVVPEIGGIQGEWVLVEGFLRGVEQDHGREMFAFLRGALVARRDVRRLRARFLAADYPGNDRIPDGASEHYLFAGEAGHRKNYAQHLLRHNGRYRRQVVEAFDRHVNIMARGRKTSGAIHVHTAAVTSVRGGEGLFGPVARTRHIRGVRMELPSIHFAWESYHSALNEYSGFYLPAPRLIQRLGLANRNREVDFHDAAGSPGILYREASGGMDRCRHNLLYVRADLLRRYLVDTRQVLVWCNWGERDWLQRHTMIDNPARLRIWRAHSHIHRSFGLWRD